MAAFNYSYGIKNNETRTGLIVMLAFNTVLKIVLLLVLGTKDIQEFLALRTNRL